MKHKHKWKLRKVAHPFRYGEPIMVSLHFCDCGLVADKNKKIIK